MAKPAPQRQPARRRARDAERTRAAILAAAREVFLRDEYHQASLSDIAKRAGVAQSLIHHHFGSKRALYVNAMHALLTDLDADLQGVVEPSLHGPEDGAAFVEAAIRGYFRFMAVNGQSVRLYRILDLTLHDDPELVEGMGRLDDQGREMSSLHLIRAAHDRLALMKERGLLRPGVEPLPLLSAVLCAVEHWFTSSRRLNHRLGQAVGQNPGLAGSQPVSDEEYLDTVIRIFVRGAILDEAAPGA